MVTATQPVSLTFEIAILQIVEVRYKVIVDLRALNSCQLVGAFSTTDKNLQQHG